MAEVPHSDVPGRPSGGPGASGPITQVPPRREEPGAGYSPGYEAEEVFSGWAWFAGGLLALVGLFQIMTGTVALAGAGYYTVPARSLVVDASYAAWGWVHLILGIVAVVTGGGLVFGSKVARVVGVALAVLSAVVNLAFLSAAPFAATLIIALDVFVIYAIAVHGGELTSLRPGRGRVAPARLGPGPLGAVRRGVR
jgi:hypothetical protein